MSNSQESKPGGKGGKRVSIIANTGAAQSTPQQPGAPKQPTAPMAPAKTGTVTASGPVKAPNTAAPNTAGSNTGAAARDTAVTPALEFRSVVKTFKQAGSSLTVLNEADLRLMPGEMVALVGPSGAGKSTLLQIAGLLDKPSKGHIMICGDDCSKMSDAERSHLRRKRLGFVYQYHHLMPEFSALENIMIPQMIAGLSKSVAKARAREFMAAMGLAAREQHRPGKLSGGEQQRVAIARAVANQPSVLLADEPTGNLDLATAEVVFKYLENLVHRARIAALVATHNVALARRMDRILMVEDGKLVERRTS